MLRYGWEAIMRLDLYTKAVLTVIAACLVWMSLGGPSLLMSVSAQQQNRSSGYERILIAGWLDVTGKEHSLSPESLAVTSGVPIFIGNQK
jgi:hypothetical protein